MDKQNPGSVNEKSGHVNNGYEKDSESSEHSQSPKSPDKTIPALQEPPMDFDDLLPHVGEFGRYQKILFLFMIPFAFFVAFVYFSQIFIILVPEQHWCHVPELSNFSVEQR